MGTSAGNKKMFKELIRDLEKQGFAVERRGSGHYAVRNHRGDTVFMPASSSDFRAIHRVHTKLKRIGFQRRRK